MNRKMVSINDEKCTGCGACAEACHEGAIAMIDGKARLVNEAYCDGLGSCLPVCPESAITIADTERPCKEEEKMAVCPGTARSQYREPGAAKERASELGQWPVQLKLINTQACSFAQADVLIAADCTAYAYARFHQEFIKGRVVLIGCPKLDDNEAYATKLTDIFRRHPIASVLVVRMEVPCCRGIALAVRRALLASQRVVPYEEIVIGIDGRVMAIQPETQLERK